jgi:hypothetical protein
MQEQLFKAIEQTWAEPRQCSVCHQQNWGFADKIYEVREFSGTRFAAGDSAVPVVVATCENCGNTLFLNAIHLGLLDVKGKVLDE